MAYPLHQDEDDDGSGYRLRESYSSISGSGHVAASDTGLIPLVAARPQHTLFIQRIHVDVTTGGASATWTFQDGAGVPILPAVVASAVTMVDLDFGAIGVPCTEGTAFVLTIPTAGAIGWLTWEGYRRLTGVETLPSSTPPHYRDLVIADGASNYWRLNEPSGLTAVDQIGGANGTISGGVTLNQPGALADGDKAMAFNGSTGKVATVSNVTLTPPFSVEAWLKTTDPTNPRGCVTFRFPNATQDTFTFGFDGANLTRLFAFITYANALSPNQSLLSTGVTPSVSDGAWHHIVWTYSSGTAIAAYLDGVFYPTQSLSRALVGTTLQPVEIGYSNALGSYWTGSLDEIAIYPVALTPAQIAAHYAARANL